MRSALEWARVRALAADGLSQREIARRLGVNRRTVARMLASDEPPRYRRAVRGSQLDPLEPVLRRLLEEWPQIKAPRATEVLREHGYVGSVDVVRRRLRELRPRSVRPAQRTGYRPGQVLQLDWAEMPTRPAGRWARAARVRAGGVAALLGRADRVLLVRHDDRVVPRGARARVRVAGGGATRVRLRQPQIGRRPARARRSRLESALPAPARPLRLPRNCLHAGDAAGEGLGRGGGALPEKQVCSRRRHASGRFLVEQRLADERRALRPLPPERFAWSAGRSVRVPLDGYLRHGGCFYRAPISLVHQRVELRSNRDEVWIRAHGITVAYYRRCYQPGTWLPAPVMRPEPPAPAPPATLAEPRVAPPELADYAELCA